MKVNVSLHTIPKQKFRNLSLVDAQRYQGRPLPSMQSIKNSLFSVMHISSSIMQKVLSDWKL